MSGSSAAPVRVLYFAGSGRSGTTIINTILGQVPGCFAAGELRYLWQRGVVENHRCGCGQPFDECPVWTGVMAEAFGPGGAPDAAGVAQRLLRRLRILGLPAMLGRRLLRRDPVPGHPDDQAISAVYSALSEQVGGDVIVDSSKLPPYGLLLSQQPDITVYVLHVVRDSRATAFSWLRTKPTKDTTAVAYMPKQEIWKSSMLWVIWNLMTAICWPSRRPTVVRMRYEDFVAAPRQAMQEVVDMLGLPREALPFVDDFTVTLAPTHSVAGNPNRHDTGTTSIRGDVEWRSAMPRLQRLIVTALTAPGLLRFGYPLTSPTDTP